MLASSPGHPSHLIYPDSACHGPSVDLRMFCSEVGRILMAVSQSKVNCAVLELQGWIFWHKKWDSFVTGATFKRPILGEIKQKQTIQIYMVIFRDFPKITMQCLG